MNDLYETFQLLKVRPANVIGSRSIEALFIFVQGWRSHRSYAPDDDAFAEAFFCSFNSFVEHELGQSPSAKGWAMLISEASTDDTALNLFLELLERFYDKHRDDEVSKESGSSL